MRSFDCVLRPLVCVCALSGGLLLATQAYAGGVLPADATPEQKKSAMDHFAAGKQAIDGGNWERATMELRASLDVVDSPNARLELARALRESGKLGDAWAEYGHVIETATKLAAQEERYAKTADAATTERSELEAKLAFVVVTVANAPPGAVLKVGGRVVPQEQWAGPVVASAGAVDVVLSDTAGKELARQTVSATVGQKTPAAVDANAAAPAGPPGKHEMDTGDDDKPGTGEERMPAPPPPPAFNKSNLRPYAYIAGGIGVAGLAAFGIFGAMSTSAYNDLKTACPPSGGGCPPNKRDEVSSGQTQQTVANVGLVVGLVGLAAGTTLFVLSLKPSAPASSAALVIGPTYVGVKGSL
jgi:hypothetical protein